jgi:enediyne core biosynthesis thioesterase
VTRAYEHRHVVLFQETNLVGNVYFVNYLAWQGSCRERFLREHVPGILAQLRDGLALVTVSCQCEYLAELVAFDEIAIRMKLVEAVQNHINLRFDYMRIRADSQELIAVGHQRIACMRRDGARLVPTPIPDALQAALERYSGRAQDRQLLTDNQLNNY